MTRVSRTTTHLWIELARARSLAVLCSSMLLPPHKSREGQNSSSKIRTMAAPLPQMKINSKNIKYLVQKASSTHSSGSDSSKSNFSFEEIPEWQGEGVQKAAATVTVTSELNPLKTSASNSNSNSNSISNLDQNQTTDRSPNSSREEKQYIMSQCSGDNANNISGTNLNSSADNDSVMTGATFMVMTRPDGTRSCAKHPILTLEGWSCPECEKAFKETGRALKERQANVDSRLQQLEGQQQQQQQQNSPHPSMAQQQAQQQQHQQQLPFMSMSPGMMPFMQPGPYGMPPGGNMNPMHAMNGGFQNIPVNSSGGAANPSSNASLETLALQINRMQQMQDWMLLQKEREVQMLRQELAEAQQNLHTVQMENAVLQEKMIQQKVQYEQDIRIMQLATANARPNRSADTDDYGISALSKEIKSISFNTDSKESGVSRANTTNPHSKSTATGTSTTTVPTTASLKSPPPPAITPRGVNGLDGDMDDSGTPKTAPKTNNNSPTKKAPFEETPPGAEAKKSSQTEGNKHVSPNGEWTQSAPVPKMAPQQDNTMQRNVLKQPGTNASGIPFDINVDDDAPPTVPLQEDITLGTIGKNQSWRAGMLEARAARSDRFEPKYVGNVDDGKGVANDVTFEDPPSFPPNDQQSLTVASSTYGEDRQKVMDKSILDPYGDRGTYTGLILKSTGMPHGNGRMVYVLQY